MPEETSTTSPDSSELGAANKSVLIRLARGLAPWLVTAAIFIYIFSKIPVAEVIASIKLVRLELFIPALLATFTVFMTLDALCFYLAFNWLATPATYTEVLIARGATFVLGVVNFMAGQGGIGYWLSKKKNVPPVEAASTVFFVMFTDFFEVIALTAGGIIFLLPEASITDFFISRPATGLVRFTFIALAILIFQISVWSFKLKIPGLGFLYRGPFAVFHKARFRHFVIIFCIKTFSYIVEITCMWVALISFGMNVSLSMTLAYMPLIFLIGAIPITVFGLGTTQAAWLYFFRGVASPAVILAATLLWSIGSVLLTMLAGIFCLARVLGKR